MARDGTEMVLRFFPQLLGWGISELMPFDYTSPVETPLVFSSKERWIFKTVE